MNLKSIIEWCNNNQGFMNAVLSLVGLSISLLALLISLYAAKLPYKKKILVQGVSYLSLNGGHDGFAIAVTNTGNRPVYITKIGVQIGWCGMVIQNPETYSECYKLLTPGDSLNQYIMYDLIKNVTHERVVKLYAYVMDAEKQVTRKYLGNTQYL